MSEKDAPETRLKRAVLAVQSGRLGEARRLLVRILRQDPRNVDAWVWLGKAVDDPEKRRERFSRALRVDPDNEEARRGLVALLSGPQAAEVSAGKPPMRISAYPLRCPNCVRPYVTRSPSGRYAVRIVVRNRKLRGGRASNSG